MQPQGTKGIHKLVPIPDNEEGKRGDWQAGSCGFGLPEEERRQGGSQLGPPLTPHSSEAPGLSLRLVFLTHLLFQTSK